MSSSEECARRVSAVFKAWEPSSYSPQERVGAWNEQVVMPLRALAGECSEAVAAAARETIAGLAGDGSGEMRLWALLEALGSCGDGRAVDLLTEALLRPGTVQTEAYVTMLDALTPGSDIAPTLVQALQRRDLSHWTRRRIVETLAERDAYAVASQVVPLLADPDAGVREAVIDYLEESGPGMAASAFRERLTLEGDEVNLGRLADALANWNDVESLPALETLLASGRLADPEVLAAVEAATAALGNR